ncbi:MAG: S8 family peptidase, partial [Prochlorococcus marinus CUG1436]|nr:S8 family peptidase [Prochlorococcus marinus CUG1436]
MKFINPFGEFKSVFDKLVDFSIDFSNFDSSIKGSENILSNDKNIEADKIRSYIVVLDDDAVEKFSLESTKSFLEESGISYEGIDVFNELGIFRIELNSVELKKVNKLEGIKTIELDENIESIDPLKSGLNIDIKNETKINIDLTKQAKQNVEIKYDFKLDFVEKNTSFENDNVLDLNDWQNLFDDSQKQTVEDNQLKSYLVSSLPPIYEDGMSITGDILPYGVKAVWEGSDVGEWGNIGKGTYAFVLDTGVVGTQTDLNINKDWGKSFITGEDAYNDRNGHGTHVSGTIGALANGVGVIGVAPGAEIIPIKVLSDAGSGSWSGVIEGIEYCVKLIEDNKLDKDKCVLNLSLGGGYNEAIDIAVKRAADKGILFSLAAGNSSRDADYYSPAAAGDHKNVYTVSAVDNKYLMPMFSNWDDPEGGDDVDIAAPGVNVRSYTSTGLIDAWSGTSMAAPHVAGALLIGGIKEGPMVKPNGWGYADPFSFVSYDEKRDPPDEPPEDPPEDPPKDPITGEIKVAVYNQTGLNGSGVGDTSDETKNLLSVVKNEIDEGEKFKLDYSLKDFTNKVKLREILADSNVFIMPEIERGMPSYDSQAKNILKEFVEGGGTLIQTGDGSNQDVRFLNDIFGWDLGGQGSASSGSLSLNTSNAKGTKFEGAPDKLSNINVTSMISRGSVSNFKAIYGNDSESSVAIIGKGLGQVIYLGEDYYSFGYANNWGEGTHRQGQYTKDSRYSHWVTEMIPRAINSAISPSKYSYINGYYSYGGEEKYEIEGYIDSKYGGGNFEAGQKIYATTSDKDSFSNEKNETGNTGYYYIETAENFEGSHKTEVKVGRYYDLETKLWINPYETLAGEKGLGSEGGYLTSKKSKGNKFDSYYEADVFFEKYSTVSGKYYYGNGDWYDFSGNISEKHGGGEYTEGEKIYADSCDNDSFSRINNETGNRGYYHLEKVTNFEGQEGDSKTNISIGNYFDGETLLNISPYAKQSGELGLGSEFGFLSSKESKSNDNFDNYLEADVFTILEKEGTSSLITDNDRYFYIKTSDGIADIKRNGRKVNSNWSNDYELISAETIGG